MPYHAQVSKDAAQQAEGKARRLLTELLGPRWTGVTTFGARVDPTTRTRYVGIDFAPSAPQSVIDQLPPDIDGVPLRVGRMSIDVG